MWEICGISRLMAEKWKNFGFEKEKMGLPRFCLKPLKLVQKSWSFLEEDEGFG